MFYTVECAYNDPETEAEWNAFYSQQKLPALISVPGFVTPQRFRAVKSGSPVYLAIHTLQDAGNRPMPALLSLVHAAVRSEWRTICVNWIVPRSLEPRIRCFGAPAQQIFTRT